jgi:hypothetical protein
MKQKKRSGLAKPRQCPNCLERLDMLENYQDVTKIWEFRLKQNEAIYEELDCVAEDFGGCRCPSCGYDLGLFSEKKAIEFLQGRLVLEKLKK